MRAASRGQQSAFYSQTTWRILVLHGVGLHQLPYLGPALREVVKLCAESACMSANAQRRKRKESQALRTCERELKRMWRAATIRLLDVQLDSHKAGRQRGAEADSECG